MDSARNIFSILPEQASTFAGKVDAIYVFLNLVSAFFTILTIVLVVVFVIRYRRRSPEDNPTPPHADSKLEILCAGVLMVLMLVMFWWGAKVFFEGNTPPKDAMEIYVTGKQWMWKIQHPSGRREINELHIPINQATKLTMTSEDVIHSFFIPAFRTKNDVVPGRYTTIWFKPTKVGKYRLFCAEYCGTEHSYMGGWVYVMSQADYELWQRGASTVQESPAVAGAKVFAAQGCATCHTELPGALGPNLNGLFGSQVELTDGTRVTADEGYIHESIVNSQAKIVAGYAPVMPMYGTVLSEEQVSLLVAYVKSLAADKAGK